MIHTNAYWSLLALLLFSSIFYFRYGVFDRATTHSTDLSSIRYKLIFFFTFVRSLCLSGMQTAIKRARDKK